MEEPFTPEICLSLVPKFFGMVYFRNLCQPRECDFESLCVVVSDRACLGLGSDDFLR